MLAHLRPDVAIVDLDMPELDGIGVIRELSRSVPECRCLVLTLYEDDVHLFDALAAGAVGFSVKGASSDDIERAVRSAAAGQVVFGIEGAARITRAAPRPGLVPEATASRRSTIASLELVDLLASGIDNVAIARNLNLAPKTIRNQVSALVDKLGGADRAGACRLARNASLGRPKLK